MIGEPTATIHLRTDRPSTDIFVRICDVRPDGRSLNIADGIVRLGGAGTNAIHPVPDDDGVVAVEVRLWPMGHRFRVGHRIRVQVSSGAHPRFARNLGSGEPTATADEMFAAEQEVFHDRVRPSAVHLPVVPVES